MGEGVPEEDGGVGTTHSHTHAHAHAQDWKLKLMAKIPITQVRKSRHREVKWLPGVKRQTWDSNPDSLASERVV